jgi:peptidoglycan/LPS O-acetylase OafA/YrhL
MSQSDVVPSGETRRLEHLDALRGIAALGVAFHHCCYSFKGIPYNEYLYDLTGQSAVVFFFLLSGFVLSRSLAKEGALEIPGIVGYYIRRFWRIVPALFGAVVFSALAAMLYLLPREIPSATEWLHQVIFKAQSVSGFSGYLDSFLLTNRDLDPPLWTIVIELIGSFLLPLLALLLRRFPSLSMSVGLVIVLLSFRSNGHPRYYIAPLFGFYLGYLLQTVEAFLHTISTRVTQWLLFFILLLWVYSLSGGFNYVVHTIILAALLALLIPCNLPWLRAFLKSSSLRFLGKISYSFYLLSLPVILLTYSALEYLLPTFLSLEPHLIPATLLFLLSLVPTILVAALSERFLECPGNRLGHRLSKFWAR